MSLNEFAQGIDYLRIKISFDYIKEVFNFLDQGHDGLISYNEFKLLNEENLRKMNIYDVYFRKKENDKSPVKDSISTDPYQQMTF